jgi:hypothetical protein
VKRFCAHGAVALGIAFGVAACDTLGVGFTPIRDIVASPARFDGQDVKVTGVVTSATKVPFVEMKAYVIRADGAELTVTTLGTLPAVNDEVSVRGRIESAAIVGGRSVGLRLIEGRRL